MPNSMNRKKSSFVSALVVCSLILSPVSCFAADSDDTFPASEDQLSLISQNCSSIKLQLQNVQKSDAKARVALGGHYETIVTSLMLNLNLRLVKNNLAVPELTEQQTSFSSLRSSFKNDYIIYSQELESLINLDCKNEPANYYKQLQVVRKKRAAVSQDVWRLGQLISTHRETVLGLKDTL